MDTQSHLWRLRQMAEWCRRAAWTVVAIGLIVIVIYTYVTISEYNYIRDFPGVLSSVGPLATVGSILPGLAAVIFFAVALFTASHVLDHFVLAQEEEELIGEAEEEEEISDQTIVP